MFLDALKLKVQVENWGRQRQPAVNLVKSFYIGRLSGVKKS